LAKAHGNALPAGYQFEGYRVEEILGAGGFGITYRARELRLERDVAIKEFLPRELAMRGDNGASVEPISAHDFSTFEYGLGRFEDEAKTLTKFRHPNIVPVLRSFDANNTAYLVMEYVEGASLFDILQGGKTLSEPQIQAILAPMLDGLETVHKTGYLHRDIKPGNIYIRADGSPVLIDFGAARAAMSERSKTLTSVVTAGYAPFEQYFARGNQGPWTDIYAMAATMHRAMTGRKPPEAPERQEDDPYRPLSRIERPGYGPTLTAGIDRALQVKPSDRPQTVSSWRDMLDLGGETPTADPELAAVVVAKLQSAEIETQNPDGATWPTGQISAITTKDGPSRSTAIAAAVSISLFVAGGGYLAWQDATTGSVTKKPVKPGPATTGRPNGSGGTSEGAGTSGSEGGSTGNNPGTRPKQQTKRPPGPAPGAGSDCTASLAALQGLYHESDCAHLSRAFRTAIGGATAAGTATRWRNNISGNRGGYIVQAFFQSAEGYYCRRFRQTVTVDGRMTAGTGAGCRINGRWRIVTPR